MSIFAELKRRNIFRVALLYIVASWLILQLINILVAQLGIPAWTFRFIFTLLLICFPMVLTFSWICELTPDGIKREQDIEAEASITPQTGRRINHITLVLLVFAILTMIVDYLIPGNTAMQTSATIKQPLDQASLTIEPVTELETSRPGIDLQGHRGARGLLPENSIPAFLHALDLGVTTLEMDVAINAEGHVVVSHEPWMSAKICTHSDGRLVTEDEEKSLRIYAMSDAEVAGFDCGSRGHPDHPRQQAMAIAKPLLSDVFLAVSAHAEASERHASFGQILYNIEIKSLPEGDRFFHPVVREFASALYRVISRHGLVAQTTVQSFDPRALEAMHEIDPHISIALLVDNPQVIQQNLDRLSFLPQIYSPNYQLLDQAQIEAAQTLNIRVIPWTVNDEETIRELVGMGVDGLITDYPDLAIEVLAKIHMDQ
mgnify:CR=1 FL=1